MNDIQLIRDYIENIRLNNQLKDGLAVKTFTAAAIKVGEEKVFIAIEKLMSDAAEQAKEAYKK